MSRMFCLLLIVLIAARCQNQQTLFKKISSSHSGISFNNVIKENDSINPLDLEFLYNGGGVAVGDFNGDSLPDLYFTANLTSNRMYINKGNFRFEEVTEKSGTTGEGRWSNGAAVVDINNDGLDDLYLCASIKKDASHRTNLLYVNQGQKNGIPVFREMARDYGLADTGYSVQSAFFDYDNDGDLDMYLVQTKMSSRNASIFKGKSAGDKTNIDIDKLYRNDWNDSLQHPVFTEVSMLAGITDNGYGLGVGIADFNNDGWKDIYVSNDFYSNDHLYLNNKNGSFTNAARQSFRHTSLNAMGNDIADINNDGLADILTVDMNPEDNYRKKKNMNGNNYNIYQNMLKSQYLLQYVRNTLQLNAGLLQTDSGSMPVFNDVAYLSGVAETDWSWSALMSDMDNDGLRDILITNGYPRDLTDHDFIVYRSNNERYMKKSDISNQIPQIKVPNYAYHNNGELKFEKVSKSWGLDQESFSNGAVCVDLDNDGDLDYVVNNINDEAFVYENLLAAGSFINLVFKGSEKNPSGTGAKATIYYDSANHQTAENSPYRGYLSSGSKGIHFGLGKTTSIDSVVIEWATDKVQTIVAPPLNKPLIVDIKNSVNRNSQPANAPLLFAAATGIAYQNVEQDFIDFDRQRLLLHKLSEYGPCLTSGDINGDGLDDLLIGGNGKQAPAVFQQQSDGSFVQKELPATRSDNPGMALFDADGDGDQDLYLSSGGNEWPAGDSAYQDKLYLNNGKGDFSLALNALPLNHTNKSCVRAIDLDKDGDQDLFIGGRTFPGRYPQAVSSFILRNDSKGGLVRFTDITEEAAPLLKNIGMVCDAVWADFDNDGWIDLAVAGEWMSVRFFRNDKGVMRDITPANIRSETGFWTSLIAADMDNDGDMDIVAGNMGLNSYYRGNSEYPVSIYSGEFGGNNSYVAIPALYLNDPLGNKKEFPAQTRDDIVDPLPALKKIYLSYKDFALADMNDLMTNKNMAVPQKLQATNMASSYIENKGGGQFEMTSLPIMAQTAPLYGIIAKDVNQDGHTDIIAVGNDWGTETTVGRYDALNGLVLSGNGKGKFTSIPFDKSGFYVPGNARGLVSMKIKDQTIFAASQNRDSLKLFRLLEPDPKR